MSHAGILGILLPLSCALSALPASAAEKTFSPSPLALAIARAEFASFASPGDTASSAAPDTAAQDAVLLFALEVERKLRFGESAQDARAELRRFLRMEHTSGAKAATRMEAKLKKVEKGRSAAHAAAKGATGAIGGNSGKTPGKTATPGTGRTVE